MAGQAPRAIEPVAVCGGRRGVRVVATGADPPAAAARGALAQLPLLELADGLVRLDEVGVLCEDSDELLERQAGAKLEHIAAAARHPNLALEMALFANGRLQHRRQMTGIHDGSVGLLDRQPIGSLIDV